MEGRHEKTKKANKKGVGWGGGQREQEKEVKEGEGQWRKQGGTCQELQYKARKNSFQSRLKFIGTCSSACWNIWILVVSFNMQNLGRLHAK